MVGQLCGVGKKEKFQLEVLLSWVASVEKMISFYEYYLIYALHFIDKKIKNNIGSRIPIV